MKKRHLKAVRGAPDCSVKAVVTPTPVQTMKGTPREALVAKLREYANRLESGELDGVRIQGRDNLTHLECVEIDRSNAQVRFVRIEIEGD